MMQASDTLYIVMLSLLSLAPDIIMDEERDTHEQTSHADTRDVEERGGF